MRNTLVLVVPALFLMLGRPASAATTYDISFTQTFSSFGGTAPTAGSFTWDGSVFTDFTVTWEGLTFDLTSAANAPFVSGEGCNGEASTPAYGFILMSQTATGCVSNSQYSWGGTDFPPSFTNGSLFFFTLQNGLSAQDTIQSNGITGNTVDTDTQSDGTWSITAEAPEPASWGLMLLGVLAIGGRGWLRKRRARAC